MSKYRVINILENISATVDHGECFYDDQEFDDLMHDIERLKNMSKLTFEKNQEGE